VSPMSEPAADTAASLRETLASTIAALDASADTVAIYRPILDVDGRFVDAEILFANEAGRRRWFRDSDLEAVRGRRLFELLPAVRPLIADLYAAVVESGAPFRGIREFPSRDGVRIFDLAISPYEGGFLHVGRDVTDERLAVERLRANEERLRRTIEGLDAMVAVQDHAGAPLVPSPQVARILGYSPEQLTSFAAWQALVHPDDLPRCLATWDQHLPSWRLEYRLRRADGTWIWVTDSGQRVPAGPGQGPGIFGVMVDTTALHEATARVRASEAMFRAAFEENPESIWVFRPVLDDRGTPVDAEVLYANRIARERYVDGLPLEELVGSRLFARWPEYRELIGDMLTRLAQGGGPIHGEMHGTRGGGEFWSETWAFPFEGGVVHVGRDVTEARTALEALRATEERLLERTAQLEEARDLAGIGDFRRDMRTGTTTWSPQLYRLFGLDPSGPAPGPDEIDEAVTPETLAERAGALARAAATGTPWDLEMHIRRPGGEERWLHQRGVADLDASGGVIGYHGTVLDITQRKRAAEALEVANARLRRFFDADIVGTVVAEAAGRVLEANDYWLRLVGRSREELGRGEIDWRATTAPESLKADDRALVDVRERGSTAPYAKVYVRSDGTRVPVLIVRATMPGPGEQIASFVLDMTERDAAAARLTRLGAAVEQAGDLILVSDTEGVIQYLNPALEALTGHASSEAVGTSVKRLLRSDVHAPEFYEALDRARRTGTPWSGRVVNRRADGTTFEQDLRISPLRDADGRLIGAVEVGRDLTRELALEADLRQAQRIEAVGQLAGGVAHDFNNLLTAIRGYGELVLAALPPWSDARTDVTEMLKAADRAAGLTRQLLAFGRRQMLAPKVLDPSTVIDELAPMLRRLLGEHIDLVVTHGPDLGNVLVDPGQLEQVIVNLAVNARDAMPDGGRLLVDSANAVLRSPESTPLPSVRITVSDTGTGMDQATLARIFEPFFTTKEPGKGTGMGLATVYGIVRQSGGRITASSTPGQGTVILIDLPVVEATDPAPEAPGPATIGAHRPAGTVLLVEDEAAVRAVVSRALTGCGFSVAQAGSGSEAIEIATAPGFRFDLLISDVRMPGIQGPDLARRLRTQRPDLPVLFISGYSADLADDMAGVPGARILDKPFDTDTLLRAVREAIGSPA